MKLSKKEPKQDSLAVGAPQPRKKRKKKKWMVMAVVIVLIVAILLAFFARGGKSMRASGEVSYIYTTVQRRTITSSLTGSGSLEAIDSYTVNSLVSGEILSSEFNTGDVVPEGYVLYEVDPSNLDATLERAQKALTKAQENYDDLVASRDDLHVTAPISGTVTGLSAKVGNSVNRNAMVATIVDTSTLLLTEYYSEEYEGRITVGMPATIIVADQMLTLCGSVKEVYSFKRVSETGVSCFAVTVQVKNPGSLSVGDSVTCVLGEQGKEIYPTIEDENGLEAVQTETVSFGISGDVAEVYVRNDEQVLAGETLMLLTSDTLEDDIVDAKDAVEDAELDLDEVYETLENYTITAPIDGTIVNKYYKAGENAENGRTLCTILDLSSLTVTLSVDELDIRSVAVGQIAMVTSDAINNHVFEGVITEVSIVGSASGGVTTYPVTVRIDDTEGLLPGMNVDVSITVQESADTLTVPTEAVQTGSRVLVKTADGSTGTGAPEGYEYVKVEIGVSDEDYVEITAGLSEGDEIAYVPDTISTSSDMFANMGGMQFGGMNNSGASMPSGGNMPSGGGNSGGPGGNGGGSRGGR